MLNLNLIGESNSFLIVQVLNFRSAEYIVLYLRLKFLIRVYEF